MEPTPSKMSKKDIAITLGMLSIAAIISLLALPQTTTHIEAESRVISINNQNYFASTTLKAKAAFVYDIANNQILYGKNETLPLPLASLTKIMTAVTAAELASKDTVVTINDASLGANGDSGLYRDERWNLNKLLQYTLVASSNDGAAAVASSIGIAAKSDSTMSTEARFIEQMNIRAQALNLNTLHFSNPSGLDLSPTEPGAIGSAKDVALLLSYALQHDADIIEPTRYSSFSVSSLDNISHTAANTDIITNRIPSLIAGKTGYTDLAGGNLAVIFDAGIQHPIAVVVLGSTYDGRFEDVQALVKDSIETIVNQQ